MSAIRVLVADDHDLLREGVISALTSFDDIEVVADARNGASAIEMIETNDVDVAILDLVMPVLDGVAAIRQLRTTYPELGLVALSSFSERSRVRAALDAGANCYMVKSVDAESLARSVRSAAAGQSAFSPEAMQALVADSDLADLSELTNRELEIADLLATGQKNAEIASTLHLSVFTVKNHVSSILMKLGVRTRTEAASVILSVRRANRS